MLFYVFWEAMLIPMFLIIGIWGGPNRIYATIKFFLYTLLGSLLMLVALLYMYNVSDGSFSILDYHDLPLALNTADPDLPGLFRGFRGQGAHVPGAHLVTGCPCGGAHRRLGYPGCHHVENGRLRLYPLQPADHP